MTGQEDTTMIDGTHIRPSLWSLHEKSWCDPTVQKEPMQPQVQEYALWVEKQRDGRVKGDVKCSRREPRIPDIKFWKLDGAAKNSIACSIAIPERRRYFSDDLGFERDPVDAVELACETAWSFQNARLTHSHADDDVDPLQNTQDAPKDLCNLRCLLDELCLHEPPKRHNRRSISSRIHLRLAARRSGSQPTVTSFDEVARISRELGEDWQHRKESSQSSNNASATVSLLHSTSPSSTGSPKQSCERHNQDLPGPSRKF